MEIKELWRYPVKSMGGERLSEAIVEPLGTAGDHVVVVVQDNRVVTARTRPRVQSMKILLVAFLLVWPGIGALADPPKVGDKAPDFTLAQIDGHKLTLSAEVRSGLGKIK